MTSLIHAHTPQSPSFPRCRAAVVGAAAISTGRLIRLPRAHRRSAGRTLGRWAARHDQHAGDAYDDAFPERGLQVRLAPAHRACLHIFVHAHTRLFVDACICAPHACIHPFSPTRSFNLPSLQDPLGFSFIVGGKAWAGSRAARAHSDAGSARDGAQPYLSAQRGQRKWRRGSLGEDGVSSAWAPSEHAPHNLKNLSHDLASRQVSCGPFDGITIKSEVAPRRRVHPRGSHNRQRRLALSLATGRWSTETLRRACPTPPSTTPRGAPATPPRTLPRRTSSSLPHLSSRVSVASLPTVAPTRTRYGRQSPSAPAAPRPCCPAVG